MTLYDAIFCLIGVSAAILSTLSEHADKLEKRGHRPEPRLTAIRARRKWFNLLMIVYLLMAGLTTMTSNPVVNGLLAFFVPFFVAGAISSIILRRSRQA